MNEYHIRIATGKDLLTVLHHRRRMFEDMGDNDPLSLETMLATSKPLFQRGLAEGTYRHWLVEVSGVGVVAGGGIIFHDFHSHPQDPKPQRAWVINMFTELGYRRRGLARLLMVTMLEWCREAGLCSLYLHASDEGRPLYENLGFKLTNEMKLTL